MRASTLMSRETPNNAGSTCAKAGIGKCEPDSIDITTRLKRTGKRTRLEKLAIIRLFVGRDRDAECMYAPPLRPAATGTWSGLTASSLAARRHGHNFYCIEGWMAGKW